MPDLRLAAIAAALLLALPAAAQPADDLAAIRRQIQDLQGRKAEDERRIADLERRLAAAEAAASRPAPAAAAPGGSLTNAFNPALGVVLNGRYGQAGNRPEDNTIPGFALGEETGPGERGFSLGESEITLSADADHLFFGSLTLALSPENEVEVEEAFVETPVLGHGLTVKAGRFFSGIGFMNAQHPHDWDFADTALPYRVFLGNQFGDDGVQLRWAAATQPVLELGGELSRGDDFPAAGNARSGKGARAAFVRLRGPIGDSATWRIGVSHLDTRAQGRETGTGPDVFGGESRLWIADAVLRWSTRGDAAAPDVTLQGEYFRREEDGLFNALAYDATQTGWYAQAVYRFLPRWRVGYRYDTLRAGAIDVGLAGTTLDAMGRQPQRNSLMVDFNPSHFSRLRLQYTHDESGMRDDDQVIAQYIVAFGADRHDHAD